MATIVLIHGAYQGGWIWQPTAKILREAGHTVYAPTLEGCADRRHQLRPGITTETHADEVANLLFYEDINDAIMVGTSSGGMVAAKTAELAKDRIARLVFVDALVPQPGESTKDIVQRSPHADPYEMTEFARGPTRVDLATRLFGELHGAQKDWALERATPHPNGLSDVTATELEGFWNATWPDSTVIYCVNSENPPEPHQRATADRLEAVWIEMPAGHYPMLTHGEELAGLLAA